jgi:hypothetical protein
MQTPKQKLLKRVKLQAQNSLNLAELQEKLDEELRKANENWLKIKKWINMFILAVSIIYSILSTMGLIPSA